MKLPEGYGPRTPCADGEHVFHPHDHSWWAALSPAGRAGKECSRRFWCVNCRNWYDGQACELAPVVTAA